MILSIDTTSEFGSIALTEANVVVEEIALAAPEGFGHVLFGHIQHLLEKNGTTVHQMECFAAASGPGSFTGVRVGLTAVKGLAEATGKRVVAVSNLRALAFFGSAPLRATVIDARRGEVYAAVYNSRLELVMPEAVLKLEDFLATCTAAQVRIDLHRRRPSRAGRRYRPYRLGRFHRRPIERPRRDRRQLCAPLRCGAVLEGLNLATDKYG